MNRIGPTLHTDRPKVVAFGGGKGGTGRSTLCAEVARSIARQGQRVLCIDASWSCPTLNILLHAEEPRFDTLQPDIAPIGEAGSHVADFIVSTDRNHIWLANIGAARQFPFVRPRLGADALIAQMHELQFDWILVDLSAGLDPLDVGLFTLSDIPVMVCSPEPAAVRMSTQYLRSAFYQAIGYHPQAKDAREEVLEMLYEQPLRMNLDSLLDGAADSEGARQVVLDTTGRRFEAYLVVNLVREGSERDLGQVLCHAWHRELNIFPRVLASVDYEDRRWFYNRRTTGLGPGRGDEALSKDTETLAKNLLEISLVDARFPRPVPRGADAHPALRLGIGRESARNDVRQHCRQLWEGYRREESLALIFDDAEDRSRNADSLETLYRQLLTMPNETFVDPSKVAASNGASSGPTTPKSPPPEAPKAASPRSASSPAKGPDPPDTADPTPSSAGQPDPPADNPSASGAGTDGSETVAELRRRTESPGEIVAALRRRADLSLQELSLRTHIGIKFLAAIEDADLAVLPRQVYLRGYLREVARIFEVDAQPLIDEYFRFLDNQNPS